MDTEHRIRILNPKYLVIFFLSLIGRTSNGQTDRPEEYQVKAVFVYNFSRFIDWPATSFSNSNSPFVIGIVGKDPFGPYLEEVIKGESVNMHPMIIKHYKDYTEIGNCHILFINYKNPDMIKKVLSVVKGKNILTVNESSSFARIGGMIQFNKEFDKIKLLINNNAVKETQLQISSKLMSVARIY